MVTQAQRESPRQPSRKGRCGKCYFDVLHELASILRNHGPQEKQKQFIPPTESNCHDHYGVEWSETWVSLFGKFTKFTIEFRSRSLCESAKPKFKST